MTGFQSSIECPSVHPRAPQPSLGGSVLGDQQRTFADERRPDGSWGCFFARFVAGQVVSFLLFAPHMAKFTRFQTRNLYLWNHNDAVCLLAGVVLVGLVFLLVDQFIRLLGRASLTRLSSHLFLLALGAGVLANLGAGLSRLGGSSEGVAAVSGVTMQTAWFILVAWVAYSWGRPSSKTDSARRPYL